ncbi:hypothetical protein FGO68_gene9397 [Halteria grandinella]|uniref:Prokaryotic-type class I peptide chain release factors domain-containing protein n=1 Tax=Halteria grandinella TaxID=5974 RepID=A0A8J8NV57_HALGN|nr:hypothetical protein FGO68_gene9397 [Halteria grandinella]
MFFSSHISPPRKIYIPESYLEVNHSRSSGPGGQNVNKVNTKVELRFTIRDAFWLPVDVRDRLREQRPQNITKDDEFIVVSQEHRTQEQNYSEALGKMQEFIDKAAIVPKERVVTEYEEGEHQEFKRIDYKRKRSNIKSLRGSRWDD